MEDFKSQICTTKEQSERLLALGLKKETADMCYKVTTHDFKGNEIDEKERYYALCCWYDESSLVCGLERQKTIPAWSLHRLMEMYGDNYNFFSLENAFGELVEAIAISVENNSFNKNYLKDKQ